MATGNAVLLNSAMASSVSIFVNVYVFTCPLCRRYSFACFNNDTMTFSDAMKVTDLPNIWRPN